MRRDESTTPDDLQRPEGNGLKANYDKHDVGEAEFIERCDDLGLVVEEWGIDMRDDGGEAGVIYDDAMDFKVYTRCNEANAELWMMPDGSTLTHEEVERLDEGHMEDVAGSRDDVEPLRLMALVDVKTKSSPRYMGRFNLRHYENYAQHAHEFGVPTFVVMFQVDYREDEVYDEFTFRIRQSDDPSAETSKRVLSSRGSHAVDPFPDGNHAVLVKQRYRRTWGDFIAQTAGLQKFEDDKRKLEEEPV